MADWNLSICLDSASAALSAALARELGAAAEVCVPSGGQALWVKVAPTIDVDVRAARELRLGVALRPGRQSNFDGAPVRGLRVGYSSVGEDELLEVARRMGAALRRAES